MADTSIPLHQCNRKAHCVHPESVNGWLPATSEYFHSKRGGKYGLRKRCRACRSFEYKRDHPSSRRNPVAVSDNVVGTTLIPLTRGHIAVVDNADADLATVLWCTSPAHKTYYAYRRRNSPAADGKYEFLHDVILSRILGRDLLPGEEVDHIDLDGLNNRRDNLRLATRVQNAWNQGRRVDNRSGYKGVGYHKHNKAWRARIKINGKTVLLGYYPTPEEAFAAYVKAAQETRGEFARVE